MTGHARPQSPNHTLLPPNPEPRQKHRPIGRSASIPRPPRIWPPPFKKPSTTSRTLKAKLENLAKNDKDRLLTDKNKLGGSADTQEGSAGSPASCSARVPIRPRPAAWAKPRKLAHEDAADGPVKTAEENAVKAGLASDQAPARLDSEAKALHWQHPGSHRQTHQTPGCPQKCRQGSAPGPGPRAPGQRAAVSRRRSCQKSERPPTVSANSRNYRRNSTSSSTTTRNSSNPPSTPTGPHSDDLVRKVQDLEKAQQPINDQLNNITAADKSSDTAAELARKQDASTKRSISSPSSRPTH